MTSAQSHLSKLDPQIREFWLDCFELFCLFVSREKAERCAWKATADAFKGMV
jgi:hypothetical protein